MKVTIKDVAEHAGVSFKTVSRVINDEDGVKKCLREKVWESIKELNYHPNLNARRLRGKSATIGFIYDNPNSNYVITMLHGILDKCRANNYELVVHPCDSTSTLACDEIIATVQRSMVAGIVLTPPMSETPEIIERLDAANIKFVRIISGSESPADIHRTICVNDRKAAFKITQHLIDMNHTKIAFFNGDLEHGSSIERFQGYSEALKANGIELNEDWVLDGHYSFESGVERAEKVVEMADSPTAIFACNDEIAAGALFAAKMASVDVPDKLSIVGFEDSPFSRQTWPSLTTAKQQNDQIAGHAVEILMAMVSDKKDSLELEEHHYLPEVIVRKSVKKLV